MGDQIVTYQEHRDDNRRLVEISASKGGLLISAQDTGPAVEKFWEESEYEWTMTVRAAGLPALRAALNLTDEEDVLAGIQRWFDSEQSPDLGALIRDAGVPHEFDSWISS